MALRKKTKWRLIVLIGLFGAVVAGGATFYFVRRANIQREISQSLAKGLAAYQQGDYYTALHGLGTYINRSDEPAADVLYKYVQARQKVEEPGGKHLVQAVGMLRRLLEMQPDNLQARKDLLELYLQLGYDTELLDTAEYILQRESDNARCVLAKAVAMRRFRRVGEALPLARQYNQMAPLDLDGQQLTFDILLQQGTLGAELVEQAKALEQAHPAAMEAKWLLAYAHVAAREHEKALELAQQIAAAENLSAELAVRTVLLLNSFGQYDKAFELLRHAADKDPGNRPVQRQLAQGLWQRGQVDELAQRLDSLDPSDPTADADLLGMLAMTLDRKGQSERAGAIADVLAGRKSENLASAWAIALKQVILARQGDAAEAAKAWQAVLDRAPGHPLFNFLAGHAYAAAGSQEKSLMCWRQAAGAAPAWPQPGVMIGRTLLGDSRHMEAFALARQLAQHHPRSVDAVVLLMESWDAVLASQSQPDATELLKVVDEFRRQLPQEPRTLVVQARWQARMGQLDEARKTIQAALEAQPAAPTEVLVQLAEISRQAKLGLETQCLDRSQEAHGLTWRLALAKALEMAADGKADEGLKMLSSAAASAPSEQSVNWRIAVASYLDRLGDKRATDEWRKLSDEFASQAAVQQAAINANCVWADKDLAKAVIDRMEAAMPDSSAWRIHKARWLMRHDQSDQAIRDATEILKTLVASPAATIEPRLLLAECYDRAGNRSGAIEQLKAAFTTRPDRPDILIQIARLQAGSGDFKTAAATLGQVARSPASGPMDLRAASAMLAELGDIDTAISAASRWHELGGGGPAAVALAEMHLHKGQFANATEALAGHIAEAQADPQRHGPVLLTAARVHIAAEQTQQAAALLSPLLKQGPQWRLMWMRLAVGIKDSDQAKAWLEQVEPTLDPQLPQEQVTLAEFWWLLGQAHKQDQWQARARQIAQPLIDRPEPVAAACQLLGTINEFGGDQDQAQKHYQQALSLDPKLHLAANNLAMILLRKGVDLDKAAQLAKAANEAQPQSPAYKDTLAQILAAQRQFPQAAQLLEQALKLQPRSAELSINYAYVQTQAGQLDKARQALAAVADQLQSPQLSQETLDRLAAVRAALEQPTVTP